MKTVPMIAQSVILKKRLAPDMISYSAESIRFNLYMVLSFEAINKNEK